MKIRKFLSLFFSECIVFLAFVFCFSLNLGASTIDLHNKTKIYSSNNSDYYSGCEDYNNYSNTLPTITVLTHGLGGSYNHWSNNYALNNSDDFAYNSKSIIEKLYQHLNGNMVIYIAKAKTDKITEEYNGYSLYKLLYSDYKNNPINKIEVDYLDDVSKHILLLFSSNIPNSTHQKVYEQFHNILDNISYQYKTFTGKLPRFNLIGHSRGGIINLMYATEHIYNVDSIYSLGTPYNGSTLGLIDSVMVMMNYYYTDIEGATYLNPTYIGVGDIMDEDVNKNLRNSWNEVIASSDVDINAVAYGSMTSIGFIKALINDMLENRKNSDKYYSIITEYQDLLNTITNVADDCPNLTSTILTIVNGLAKIAAKFGINLYDTILGSIDSNLVGTVTVEDAEKVLSLYNVINDETVIMDDLFIDTDSQLGYGFSDGINFNGFERYVKVFNASDLSINCAIPSSPAIPHNLEIMCDEYIDDIVISIEHGSYSANINALEDDTSNTFYFSHSKVFKLNSIYKGERTITANNCQIDVYYYDNGYLKKEIIEQINSLTVEMEANVTYLIIITRIITGNTTVSCSFEDMINIEENTSINDIVLIPKKEEVIIKIKVNDLSTYRFKYTNSTLISASLYDSSDNKIIYNIILDNDNNMKCFGVQLSRGTYYLIIENISTSLSVNVSLQIEDHTHSYIYSQIITENKHLASCSTCGYETTLSHVYDNHICIHCGEETTLHDYDKNYVWMDLRTHTAECDCGVMTAQPHVVSNNSFSSGSSYAACLLCGGNAEIGFTQLNINSSIINKVTNNGSFILPNGVIVLQDEDIEAYLNGTLKFYNKNEVIE